MASNLKTCSSKVHEEVANGKEFKLINIVSSRKVSKETIDKLLPLGSRAKFICNVCVEHAENQLPTKKNATECDYFIKKIINGDFSEEQLCRISNAIGEHIGTKVSEDAFVIANVYKCPGSLATIQFHDWLMNRNAVLRNFLMSVCNVDNVYSNVRKVKYLCTAIDCVYKAKDLNFVSPICFGRNLLSYQSCGSKVACDLLADILPSGSYSTVTKWLEDQSSGELPYPKANDIFTFIDNNQVLARNWRVRYDSKLFVSVITTVMHILPPVCTNFQTDVSLSPSSWLYNNNYSSSLILNKISELVTFAEKNFSSFRDELLAKRIRAVYLEQVSEGTCFKDNVDNMSNCRMERNSLLNMYESVPTKLHEQKARTVMGEPVLLNPCSYSSVEKVLLQVSKSAVDAGRKWTIVGSDGLPYLLGSRLLDKDPSLQHILLLPGLGHFEINMVRSLFKLLFDVILSDLAKLLNFKSQKAQDSCRNAFDHHKSFQILTVFFFGTCDELIVPYVRQCLSKKQVANLHGFYTFLAQIKNPNVLFLKDVIFTYVLALFAFRAGVRRNNADLILAGRIKFSPLFYGFNQTSYQEIEYRDLLRRVSCPHILKSFLENNESFSVSGDSSRAEGGDFILESRNRASKSWMPPGIPDERRWLRSVRNLDKLDEIREHFSGAKEPDPYKNICLSTEILNWRQRLRKSGYIGHFHENLTHVSLSGIALDSDARDFAVLCKRNRDQYFQEMTNTSAPGKHVKLNRIFILPSDRSKFNDVSKKTKAQLQEMISNIIAKIRTLGDFAKAEILTAQFDVIGGVSAKKDCILQMYKECAAALQETESEEAQESDDDDLPCETA